MAFPSAQLTGSVRRRHARALPICTLTAFFVCAWSMLEHPLTFMQMAPCRGKWLSAIDQEAAAVAVMHFAGRPATPAASATTLGFGSVLCGAMLALLGHQSNVRRGSGKVLKSRLAARGIAGDKWTSEGETVWCLHENVASVTGDSFTIKDGEGEVRIKANAAIFNIKDEIELLDAETEQELCTIRQELLHLSPTYRICVGGDVVATVRKDRFSPVFKTIRVYEGNAEFNALTNSTDAPCLLQLNGGMVSSRKTYVYDGQTEEQIAFVKEKSWTPGSFFGQDDYAVSVQEGGDIVLILAAMIVKDELTETEEDQAE
mmetsp:Transcript_17123/g.45225  ORF Transcript_17123/g.45225 Transcript_17123/m.45225 type:complete len:316 (-) Transcript_17123:65-1012(-)